MNIGTLVPLLSLVGIIAVGYGWLRLRSPEGRKRQAGRQPGSDSVAGTRGGYAFTGRGEHRVLASWRDMDDDIHTNEDDFLRVSIALARPVPPLRVEAREPDGYRAIVLDVNAGAVATGFPKFDDAYLVRCDDIAFVRRLMTPQLTRWILDHRMSAVFTERDKGLSGIDFSDGAVSVERRGSKLVPERTNPTVDYLLGLVALLPPELAPRRGTS
jgi:hypothetical protein